MVVAVVFEKKKERIVMTMVEMLMEWSWCSFIQLAVSSRRSRRRRRNRSARFRKCLSSTWQGLRRCWLQSLLGGKQKRGKWRQTKAAKTEQWQNGWEPLIHLRATTLNKVRLFVFSYLETIAVSWWWSKSKQRPEKQSPRVLKLFDFDLARFCLVKSK